MVDNLPTTGGYAGLSDWSNQGAGNDRLNSHRTLAQSAGSMAASNNGVLWLSAVWHFQDNGYYAPVGIALTGGGNFEERAKTISNSPAGTGNAIGVGSGAVLDASLLDLNPTFWANGTEFAQTMGTNISTSLDNVIILKFEFGATDTVRAWYFTEGQAMSEAAFNTNAKSVSSTIDENTLNTLVFSASRFGNAVDEIRIGNSFAAVIGVQGAPPDLTPPTLVNIADDRGGEPVQQYTPVNYTVTFSEEMKSATVTAADFSNAGSSSVAIGPVTQTLPGVFAVQVTPTTSGTLRLQIPSGAALTDLSNNALDTAIAIQDDALITVNPAMVIVPNVVGMQQAGAESDLVSSNLSVGGISGQYHESVPAGNVMGQDPPTGSSVAYGSPVNLVVSLGPFQGKDYANADIPVSGTVTGSQADTRASNNIYQQLRELETSGNPNNRYSYLEHKWSFNVAGGDTVKFHVEAHHTSNSENDDFIFAYSTTGVNGSYQNMLTVTKTADDNTAQTFTLPSGTSGAVHVRVIDTNRTAGRRSLDTLYIDEMYFLSLITPPQTDQQIWAAQWPGANLGDSAADLDKDGLSNGQERIWGLDPTNPASTNPYASAFNPQAGGFSYTRRNPALTGYAYTVWISDNLVEWSEDTGAQQAPGAPDANGVQTVAVTLSPSASGTGRMFVRVRAVKTP